MILLKNGNKQYKINYWRPVTRANLRGGWENWRKRLWEGAIRRDLYWYIEYIDILNVTDTLS